MVRRPLGRWRRRFWRCERPRPAGISSLCTGLRQKRSSGRFRSAFSARRRVESRASGLSRGEKTRGENIHRGGEGSGFRRCPWPWRALASNVRKVARCFWPPPTRSGHWQACLAVELSKPCLISTIAAGLNSLTLTGSARTFPRFSENWRNGQSSKAQTTSRGSRFGRAFAIRAMSTPRHTPRSPMSWKSRYRTRTRLISASCFFRRRLMWPGQMVEGQRCRTFSSPPMT